MYDNFINPRDADPHPPSTIVEMETISIGKLGKFGALSKFGALWQSYIFKGHCCHHAFAQGITACKFNVSLFVCLFVCYMSCVDCPELQFGATELILKKLFCKSVYL